jgi:hypothetical protein
MKTPPLIPLVCAVSVMVIMLMPGASADTSEYTFQWAVPPGIGIHEPSGIALDPAGNIYATDMVNHSVWRFGPDGSFQKQWGSRGTGNGQFNYPSGIAVNNSGFVYVTDSINHRIQVFTSNGTYVTKWGVQGTGNGEFIYPNGIAVNSSGYVYVADTNNFRIQVFTSGGTYVRQWGNYGSADGEFIRSLGIAVNSSDFVYVPITTAFRHLLPGGPMSPSGGHRELAMDCSTIHGESR